MRSLSCHIPCSENPLRHTTTPSHRCSQQQCPPPPPLHTGGRFRLEEYSVLPNPLPLPSAVTLLDILDCMSFVRTHMRGARHAAVVTKSGMPLS